ncbi:hypothetical protein C5167_040165 [Papaver somniferum]|uniref:Uncharacterized protein n=1 Tax=Papaver somniferum TaxID=3469 RepID=A0A4Y7IID8_PAPSO|nr:hypothetical protein C5167_040165 [Papaver somniferum]
MNTPKEDTEGMDRFNHNCLILDWLVPPPLNDPRAHQEISPYLSSQDVATRVMNSIVMVHRIGDALAKFAM